MAHTILLVEDDFEIVSLVEGFLVAQGFEVRTTTTVASAIACLHRNKFDLVLLDVMLPDGNGLDACGRIKSMCPTPVIIISAIGEEVDRIVGLEMGADDYLPKPFSPRELLARVRAILRRCRGAGSSQGPKKHRLRFSGWELDLGRRELRSADGVLVEISSTEFDLLSVFLQHPQKVLSRELVLQQGRNRIAGPEDRSVDVHIGRLRRKLGDDPKNPQLIKTIRGEGYLMACSVEWVT